mgnify:CR=1 FL=1
MYLFTIKHDYIDSMEYFTRQLKARNQRVHYSNGSQSGRRCLKLAGWWTNFTDQAKHNFGFYRQAGVDSKLE